MAWCASCRSKRAGQSVMRRSVGRSVVLAMALPAGAGTLGQWGSGGLGRLFGWLGAQAGLVRQGPESEGLQLQASAAAATAEGEWSLSPSLRLRLRSRVLRVENGSQLLVTKKESEAWVS